MASYVLLTLDGDECAGPRRHDVRGHQHDRVGRAARRPSAWCTPPPARSAWPSCRARLAGAGPAACATGLQLLLLVAFGLKAAVFPLFFWLPDSYPTARSPVTAVFAGLLTKIGVYAIVRTQTLLFPGAHSTLLLWIAGLTMVVGVLGAIAQNDVKRILSFHIVSQIGYMVFGIAIGGVGRRSRRRSSSCIHQIPIKTSLFLVDGMIEHSTGTSRLDRLSGLAHRSGFLAVLFLLPALSLAGHPAVLRLRRQARPRHRRVRRRQRVLVVVALAVQPAHAGVDDEDLAVGVLGRAGAGDGLARPASAAAAGPTEHAAAGRSRWLGATRRARRRSAWPSPCPPARCTRCASAPRPTWSRRRSAAGGAGR